MRAAILLTLLCAPALADPSPELAARSQAAASLFVRACVAFGGDAQATRRWAAEQRFALLPPEARDPFLAGLPGLAFDASTQGARNVLVSGDDGECTTVADRADPETLLPAIERTLVAAGMTLDRSPPKSEAQEQPMVHTGYMASKGKTVLSVLVSTSRDGGQAMLSLLRPLAIP